MTDIISLVYNDPNSRTRASPIACFTTCTRLKSRVLICLLQNYWLSGTSVARTRPACSTIAFSTALGGSNVEPRRHISV